MDTRNSYKSQHVHRTGKNLGGIKVTGPGKKKNEPPKLTEEEKKQKEKEELEKQKQNEKEEKERQLQKEKEEKQRKLQLEKEEKERKKRQALEEKERLKKEKEELKRKEKEEKERKKQMELAEKERLKNKGKVPQEPVKEEQSPREVRLLLTITMPPVAKRCYFYKDDDVTQTPVKLAVGGKHYAKFGNLLTELSKRLPGLNHGVRSIFTADGTKKIESVDDLEDNQKYVCSTYRHFMRGVDIAQADAKPVWHWQRPPSGVRALSKFLKEGEQLPVDVPKPLGNRGTQMAYAYDTTNKMPKRIILLKNGEPSKRRLLLLNRRTAQTFEQVLDDIGDTMSHVARRLYSTKGRQIVSLSDIFNGPDVIVVCGDEVFRPMNGTPLSSPRKKDLTSRPGGSLPTTAKAL